MRVRITASQMTLATLALASAAPGQEVVKEWVAPYGSAAFGSALSTRGDLNGDGIRDLVVSSSALSLGPSVLAYCGATGDLLWLAATPLPVNGSSFGESLDHAGDIDQDGKDDVLVSNPRFPNGSAYGAVYLLSGADGTHLLSVSGPGNAALYLAEFGSAIAGGADVDGDTVPDFAVSAPGANGAFPYVGAVFVFSGADGSVLRQYFGATENRALGRALALLEVDGDSRAELAISSTAIFSVPAAGPIEIYAGIDDSLLVTIPPPPMASKSFGRELCAIGDVDGDGADDLAIGAPHGSDAPGVPGSKSIHLASGATGSILYSVGDPSDGLGGSIGGGDDLDGDNIPDLVAGSPGTTSDGVVGGRAFAFSGASGQEIWKFSDPANGGQIGYAVSTIGDRNSDRRAEAVVSAPFEEVQFLTSGRVRLIWNQECGDVLHYGTVCTDDYFFTPTLNLVGCPTSEATIALVVETNVSTYGILVLGAQPAALPIASGCTLLVGPPHVAIGPFYIPGFGTAFELPGTLPSLPASFTFHAQAIVRKGIQGINASRGLTVTVVP